MSGSWRSQILRMEPPCHNCIDFHSFYFLLKILWEHGDKWFVESNSKNQLVSNGGFNGEIGSSKRCFHMQKKVKQTLAKLKINNSVSIIFCSPSFNSRRSWKMVNVMCFFGTALLYFSSSVSPALDCFLSFCTTTVRITPIRLYSTISYPVLKLGRSHDSYCQGGGQKPSLLW